MEIERKYLVKHLPVNLDQYPSHSIRQAYICTDPVIRVRQKDDQFILTIKGRGMMVREEVEMPLSEGAFRSLYNKKEGIAIEKSRYIIPDSHGYTIELDLFHGPYEGFVMAEVEFPTEEEANAYSGPAWFGREVTEDPLFFNSVLSSNTSEKVKSFMDLICPGESY